MTKTRKHTPPEQINGTPVCETGTPMELRGEQWVTLVPEAEDDGRIWEFSTTTGWLVQTRS